MSGVIGKFARDINDAAQVIASIDTAGIEGEFGDAVRDKQITLAATLEEFSATLNDLQNVTDEHRQSELTFLSTAPTLADIEAAQTALTSAQTVRAAVDSGSAVPVLMGLDIAQMGAAEQAQQRLTALTEQRREAIRIFLETQARLHGQISNILLPQHSESRGRLSGTESPSGGGNFQSAASPGMPRSAPGRPAGSAGSRNSDPGVSAGSGAGGYSTAGGAGDPGAAVIPAAVPAAGAVGLPNPAALAGRMGPPVMPGYMIPGTTISAGGPTAMSDRDFNSLLDRIKGDRPGMPASAPTMPSGSGGGGGGGGMAPGTAAPRTVQPPSWMNAVTAQTGVSEGQNGRGVAAPSSASNTSPHPRSGMPPMAPMMPGGANAGGAARDPKDQPQIKNADPDVYGDDVQTIDPIIDNQKGRFS
jgi:hypothetical protein